MIKACSIGTGHLAGLGWLPWLLLFVSYPVSLFVPVRLGVPLLFHIAVPSFLIVSLLATGWLLLTPPAGSAGLNSRQKKVYYWLLLGILGACVISGWVGRTADPVNVLRFMGYFAVPLFFATCPRRFVPRSLPFVLGLLWLVNVLHGLWQVYVGFMVVGLGGNPNWFSPVIVATSPWAFLCFRQWLKTRGVSGRIPELVTGLVVGALTLLLVFRADCRATWLALLGYALLFGLWPRLCRWRRALLISGLIAGAVVLPFFRGAELAEVVQKDIRLPLWSQVGRMSLDHPVLGVGPGNFRREFAGYRSDAQKARAVAAAVTEHPHNEFLHVFATLGIPMGVVWLLFWFPVFRPFRSGGIFGLVHFSVFIIAVHACFDKVLVQPPGNLLGFCLLGILWRPRLRWRCMLQARPPLLRHLAVPVGLVLMVAGVALCVRELRTGLLLRYAYLCEMDKNYQGAYNAYRRAALVNPANVRTHAYAGICANNKLRNPKLALPHLETVYRLEPNFAHVNGQIGLALGALGENKSALFFFERETQLYPYDAGAHQQLFTCRLLNGSTEGLSELWERIGDLHYRRLVQLSGEKQVAQLGRDWLQAVEDGRREVALKLATALVQHARPAGAEPGFRQLARQTGVSMAFRDAGFSFLDFQHWKRCLRLQAMIGNQCVSPAELLALVKSKATGGDSICILVDLALASGYQAAVLKFRGQQDDGVELWREGRRYVVMPEAGQILDENSMNDLEGHVVQRLLPVTPSDFCLRNQVLLHIVRRAMPSENILLCGQSPALRLLNYHALLADKSITVSEGGIAFDPSPWQRLAEAGE